jgi:hypothetical protein
MSLGSIWIEPSSEDLIYQYLSTNGDGTGDIDAISDYSSGETQFFILPPENEIWQIERLMVSVFSDNGFEPDTYGNLSPLPNGLILDKRMGTDNVVIDITSSVPIKDNKGWAILAYDAKVNQWGKDKELLSCRFTFAKTGGVLRLNGNKNERLILTVSDDLTGLLSHRFFIQGHIIPTKHITG